MKELLVMGYNKGVKMDTLDKIHSTSSQDDVLYKALETLSQKSLEPKIKGIKDYLNKKSSFLIGFSTLATPILIYTKKQTKTAYNEHYVKDKLLFCNDKDWIKQLFFLGNNIQEYDEDYKETLEALMTKTDKSLKTLVKDISNEQIKGLVLNKSRSGALKATAKRKAISLTGSYEAYPMIYLWGYALGILSLGKDKLIKITYERLDGNERVHYFSLNERIILDIYEKTDLAEGLSNIGGGTLNLTLFNQKISTSILDGLLTLPDLSLPKNSAMFTRKITLASIKSIEDVTEDKKVIKYLNQLVQVDTENVVTNFMYHFPNISDEEKDSLIKEFNLDKDAPIDSSLATKDSIETTAFRVRLHNYMLEHQEEYPNYTGLIREFSPNLDGASVGTLKEKEDEDLDLLDF